MASDSEIPLLYESKILEKVKKITQKFKKDGEEIKVNLYQFSNDGDESIELLLTLIKDFDNMVSTYGLFTELTVTKVIDRFRRCLSGTALEDWDLIRSTTPANTRDAFLACKFELIEKILDDEAVENQVQYLKRTKKPRSVEVKRWIKRMRLINSFLPKMEANTNAMTEIVLIKECIRPNIPNHWMEKFEMQGGKDKSTIKETSKILERIEKWESKGDNNKKPNDSNKRKPEQDSKGNGNKPSKRRDPKPKGILKDGKPKAAVENCCKLPNHQNHQWKDCVNNPNGKNFKSTAKNFRDFNEDGSKKEQNNNIQTEKENRKTISWSDESEEEYSFAMQKCNGAENAMSAEILISVPVEKGSKKSVTVVALFDTGTSKSLMDKSLIENSTFETKKGKETIWKTQAGEFTTKENTKVEGMRIPQFTTKWKVDFEFSMFDKGGGYDIILGRYFGQQIGINVLNKSQTFEWDEVEIPMVPRGYWTGNKIKTFHEECRMIRKEEANKAEVLDAKYEKINVNEVTQSQDHLNMEQKNLLKTVLEDKIKAFQGTRGK